MNHRLSQILVTSLLLLGTLPQLANAQSSIVNSERIDELARQLEETKAELKTTQAHLRALREHAGTGGQHVPEPLALRPIPPMHDTSGPIGHAFAVSAQQQEANCDSCRDCGKPVCTGLPPLCDCCKEQLSWSKGGFRLVPYGAVVGEMIGSNISPQLCGSPLFLLPGPAPGIDDSRFSAIAQQSTIGLSVTGPSLGTFQSGANVAVNFFGEQPIQNNPGLFFLVANAELRNDAWRFWIGQDGDAIGRQNTNSPAWSSHKMQGNFGQLRPGFRVERYFQFSDNMTSSLYFGLTQQAVNDFIADPEVAGIDNGWPNVEARWELTLGPPSCAGQHPVLLAIGGLVGETRAVDNLALSASNVSTTWAVIPELRIEGERLGFQGEAFVGQAMGTYNGAIGQSLNPINGEPIYSVGGFGELFWKMTPYFTTSVGYGIDNPRNADLGTIGGGMIGQRARNESYWVNFIWKLSDEWETRFEVSHLETTYIAPSNCRHMERRS